MKRSSKRLILRSEDFHLVGVLPESSYLTLFGGFQSDTLKVLLRLELIYKFHVTVKALELQILFWQSSSGLTSIVQVAFFFFLVLSKLYISEYSNMSRKKTTNIDIASHCKEIGPIWAF